MVVPPFHGLTRPALGVSQLKAILQAQGLRAEVLYLNLLFARRIGLELYEQLTGDALGPLLGEMIFSQVLFDRSDAELDRYITQVMPGDSGTEPLEYRFPDGERVAGRLGLLRHLASVAGDFCGEEAIREILARDPWMVGFSSTFQQTCPSLALMREVKRRRPELLTILGGANTEGEMGEELFARFPELDFIGQGECDHSFLALVRALRKGASGGGIRGVLARSGAPAGDPQPLETEDLDALPYPDFTDYFAQLSAGGLTGRIRPTLVMETSRGCWWGAVKHCTFCGLNGQGMAFRSKRPERTLAEMSALVERYGVKQIEVVDNILDMEYFKTVLPRLAERPLAQLFYETKANLTRDQVRLLARAEIRWIQPGIESLSDRSLGLMRKGVSALQNIQLLKWCMESGIFVVWTHLLGFPGEDQDEIHGLERDFEAIAHLKPPNAAITISIHRFSPYFHSAEEFGLGPIAPAEAYRHVFPFPDESLRRIAYFYDCDALATNRGSEIWAGLRRSVDAWREAHRTSQLLAIPRARSLILFDTRVCAKRFAYRLTGLRRTLYEYCDRARSERDILRSFASEATPDQLVSILQSLARDRLMLERGGRYLSLATSLEQGRYRAYPAGNPAGKLSPEVERGRGLRRLLTLQIRPRALAGGALRELRRARRRVKSGIAVRLGRRLVQGRPDRQDYDQPGA
jgi:ribosomal peptide maturation radical SAM protein 1